MAKKFKRKDGFKSVNSYFLNIEVRGGDKGAMKRMQKFDSRVKK